MSQPAGRSEGGRGRLGEEELVIPMRRFAGDGSAVRALTWWLDRRGRVLIAIGGDSGTLRVLSWFGNLTYDLPGHSDRITGLVRSASSSLLASASDDGTVRVWDTGDGSLVSVLDGRAGPVTGVAWLPVGGRELLAAVDAGGVVRLWDPRRSEQVSVLDDYQAVAVWASWRADVGGPAVLVVLGGDGAASVLVPSGLIPQDLVRVDTFAGHTGRVTAMTWTPGVSDVMAATGGADGMVRVWDASDGPVATFVAHGGAVTVLAWASGGDPVLATAGEDGVVRLWRPGNDTPDEPLSAHTGAVTAMDWFRGGDGQLTLFTAGQDGLVRLWRPGSDVPIQTLSAHTGGVTAMVRMPSDDGRPTLFTAGQDGLVRRWRIRIVPDTVPLPGSAVVHLPDNGGRTRMVAGQTIAAGPDWPRGDLWLHVHPEGTVVTRSRRYRTGGFARPVAFVVDVGFLNRLRGRVETLGLQQQVVGGPAGETLESGEARYRFTRGERAVFVYPLGTDAGLVADVLATADAQASGVGETRVVVGFGGLAADEVGLLLDSLREWPPEAPLVLPDTVVELYPLPHMANEPRGSMGTTTVSRAMLAVLAGLRLLWEHDGPVTARMPHLGELLHEGWSSDPGFSVRHVAYFDFSGQVTFPELAWELRWYPWVSDGGLRGTSEDGTGYHPYSLPEDVPSGGFRYRPDWLLMSVSSPRDPAASVLWIRQAGEDAQQGPRPVLPDLGPEGFVPWDAEMVVVVGPRWDGRTTTDMLDQWMGLPLFLERARPPAGLASWESVFVVAHDAVEGWASTVVLEYGADGVLWPVRMLDLLAEVPPERVVLDDGDDGESQSASSAGPAEERRVWSDLAEVAAAIGDEQAVGRTAERFLDAARRAEALRRTDVVDRVDQVVGLGRRLGGVTAAKHRSLPAGVRSALAAFVLASDVLDQVIDELPPPATGGASGSGAREAFPLTAARTADSAAGGASGSGVREWVTGPGGSLVLVEDVYFAGSLPDWLRMGAADGTGMRRLLDSLAQSLSSLWPALFPNWRAADLISLLRIALGNDHRVIEALDAQRPLVGYESELLSILTNDFGVQVQVVEFLPGEGYRPRPVVGVDGPLLLLHYQLGDVSPLFVTDPHPATPSHGQVLEAGSDSQSPTRAEPPSADALCQRWGSLNEQYRNHLLQVTFAESEERGSAAEGERQELTATVRRYVRAVGFLRIMTRWREMRDITAVASAEEFARLTDWIAEAESAATALRDILRRAAPASLRLVAPVGQPLLQDVGVTAVAVVTGPDGQVMPVTGDTEGAVVVWDARSAQAIHDLAGHAGTVWALTSWQGVDGEAYVASGVEDDAVQIRDARTGQVVRVLAGHAGGVWALTSWLGVGGERYVASVGGDHRVRVWDVSTGQLVHDLAGQTGEVWALTSCQGVGGERYLISAGDHRVRVWDVNSGEVVRVLTGHTREVRALASWQGANGEAYVAMDGADNAVRIRNARTGRVVRVLTGHTGEVWALTSWLGVGGERYLASGGSDHTVRVWGLHTGRVRVLTGHADRVTALAWGEQPDGERVLFSASDDETVLAWPAEETPPVEETPPSEETPSGARTIQTARVPTTAAPDDPSRYPVAPVGQPLLQTSVTALAVVTGTDGQVIPVTGDARGAMRIWDAHTGRVVRVLTDRTSYARALTSWQGVDGEAYVASGGADGTVRVWDVSTGQSIRTLEGHTGYVRALTSWQGVGGERYVASGADLTVQVWDANTGQSIRTLEGHTGYVWALTSCQGVGGERYLISGGWDHRVRVWDASTGRIVRVLTGHTRQVRALTSWQGADEEPYVAIGGADGAVRIRNARTGRVVRTLTGHTGWVWALTSWLGVGGERYLASGGSDHTVRVWDLRTGRVRVLTGHADRVTALAWGEQPDGERVLFSASDDETVLAWPAEETPPSEEALDGDGTVQAARVPTTAAPDDPSRYPVAPVGQPLLHNARVMAVAVVTGTDGQVIPVAGDAAGAVVVWDAHTGQVIVEDPEGHTGYVWALTSWQGVDGEAYVASGGWDRTVRVWDVSTGQSIRTLEGHTGYVWALTSWQGVDGEAYVASGGWDRTVRVWDANTGQSIRTLEGHTGWVSALTSCQGVGGDRYLISAGDHRVRVWDVNSGEVVRVLTGHTRQVRALASWQGADGEAYVAMDGADNAVRIRNALTGRVVRTLTGHTGWVWALTSWLGVGGERYLASGGSDHTVRVWDLRTGRVRVLTGHADRVTALAWGEQPDGERVLFSASDDETVLAWPAEETPPSEEALDGDGTVQAAHVPPVSVPGGSSLHLVDPMGQPLLHEGRVSAVAVVTGPDGQVMPVTGDVRGTMRVWDAHTGRVVRTLTGHTDGVWALESWQGVDGQRYVASGSDDRTVRVWNAGTGEEIRTLTGHTDWVGALAAWQGVDGQRYLASAGVDQTVRVWNADTGEEIRTLTGHTDGVGALAAWQGVDGQHYLASGSDDHTVRVWNAGTGEEIRTLTGHTDGVWALESWQGVDGQRYLASAGADHTVRVWNAGTGEEIRSMTGHADSILALAWGESSDGQRILFSASDDETVLAWPLEETSPSEETPSGDRAVQIAHVPTTSIPDDPSLRDLAQHMIIAARRWLHTHGPHWRETLRQAPPTPGHDLTTLWDHFTTQVDRHATTIAPTDQPQPTRSTNDLTPGLPELTELWRTYDQLTDWASRAQIPLPPATELFRPNPTTPDARRALTRAIAEVLVHGRPQPQTIHHLSAALRTTPPTPTEKLDLIHTLHRHSTQHPQNKTELDQLAAVIASACP